MIEDFRLVRFVNVSSKLKLLANLEIPVRSFVDFERADFARVYDASLYLSGLGPNESLCI